MLDRSRFCNLNATERLSFRRLPELGKHILSTVKTLKNALLLFGGREFPPPHHMTIPYAKSLSYSQFGDIPKLSDYHVKAKPIPFTRYS